MPVGRVAHRPVLANSGAPWRPVVDRAAPVPQIAEATDGGYGGGCQDNSHALLSPPLASELAVALACFTLAGYLGYLGFFARNRGLWRQADMTATLPALTCVPLRPVPSPIRAITELARRRLRFRRGLANSSTTTACHSCSMRRRSRSAPTPAAALSEYTAARPRQRRPIRSLLESPLGSRESSRIVFSRLPSRRTGAEAYRGSYAIFKAPEQSALALSQ